MSTRSRPGVARAFAGGRLTASHIFFVTTGTISRCIGWPRLPRHRQEGNACIDRCGAIRAELCAIRSLSHFDIGRVVECYLSGSTRPSGGHCRRKRFFTLVNAGVLIEGCGGSRIMSIGPGIECFGAARFPESRTERAGVAQAIPGRHRSCNDDRRHVRG
jgi:hypothetical protein